MGVRYSAHAVCGGSRTRPTAFTAGRGGLYLALSPERPVAPEENSMASAPAKAAFLGLGAIGRPMAARLARTMDLVVWNRTRSRAEEFARESRGLVAATPREAGTGAG